MMLFTQPFSQDVDLKPEFLYFCERLYARLLGKKRIYPATTKGEFILYLTLHFRTVKFC